MTAMQPLSAAPGRAVTAAAGSLAVALGAFACSGETVVVAHRSGASSGGAAGGAGAAGAGSGAEDGGLIDASGPACPRCSPDQTRVIGCAGEVLESCGLGELCAGAECRNACEAARATRSSVGCEYYAAHLESASGVGGGCFVAFVANTSPSHAHVRASFGDTPLDLGAFAKLPSGSGKSLVYTPYDPAQGLPPGEVAILFLASTLGTALCPVPAAVGAEAALVGTGIGTGFLIETDVPVVAFQMLPYGGGSAAVTGASLLLPISAWGTNYLAVAPAAAYGIFGPTLNVVAASDETEVTILPSAPIVGGGGVAASAAGQPVSHTLSRGQMLQISQPFELTGSPIESSAPVGVWSGHAGLTVPLGTQYADHAEQQLPHVTALGHRYAAVGHRARTAQPEHRAWRLVGAVDGTTLTYVPGAPGPASLDQGEAIDFSTDEAFVVESQDPQHPFLLFAYMSGSTAVGEGYGDADFVRVVALDQYLTRYVFFADPTYPETNLVVVRRRGAGGFADVTLDCASGPLGGWTALGADGDLEWTRVDLVRHDFESQNGCDNGRRVISSTEPFGVTVWGWGTPETSGGSCNSSLGVATCNVSYGYPAGEGVFPLNDVYVPPVPK